MDAMNLQTRFCCSECGAENRTPGVCQVCGEGRTERQQVILIRPAAAFAWDAADAGRAGLSLAGSAGR